MHVLLTYNNEEDPINKNCCMTVQYSLTVFLLQLQLSMLLQLQLSMMLELQLSVLLQLQLTMLLQLHLSMLLQTCSCTCQCCCRPAVAVINDVAVGQGPCGLIPKNESQPCMVSLIEL